MKEQRRRSKRLLLADSSLRVQPNTTSAIPSHPTTMSIGGGRKSATLEAASHLGINKKRKLTAKRKSPRLDSSPGQQRQQQPEQMLAMGPHGQSTNGPTTNQPELQRLTKNNRSEMDLIKSASRAHLWCWNEQDKSPEVSCHPICLSI